MAKHSHLVEQSLQVHLLAALVALLSFVTHSTEMVLARASLECSVSVQVLASASQSPTGSSL